MVCREGRFYRFNQSSISIFKHRIDKRKDVIFLFSKAFRKGLSSIGFNPTLRANYHSQKKPKDGLSALEGDWEKIGNDFKKIEKDWEKIMNDWEAVLKHEEERKKITDDIEKEFNDYLEKEAKNK